jgi:DNA-binding NarL/FixJ family response regulator
VLVVSADPLARSGLSALLSGEGIAVVGPATELEAPRLATAAPGPEAILWDPGESVGTALERSRDLLVAGAPVLALAPDESGAGDLLAAGARGALLRDSDGTQLASSLQAVADGSIVIDQDLVALVRPRLPSTASVSEPLTPRESEVVQLLALGLSNKEIAGRLDISEHTAKFHVMAILAKLGAQSRTEAVVRAARLGLIIL